tara:strand:+ start:1371 stop:2081 length:711 start_codon:yes stop_codon:yes gene_type:complete
MINTNRLYLIVQLLRQQLASPITLTTTGTSGVATLTGNALNVPNYATGGVSDGDKGDIVVSGSGTVWTIDTNVVTNSKLATVATATLKGRITGGTGNSEDLTGTQATTLLDAFTSGLKGLAPASGGGTTNFLRADGTWAAAGSGTVSSVGVSSTDLSVSGSPVTTSGSITLNINNNAVTYGKMQLASAASRLIGSPSSGTTLQEITLGTNLSMSAGTLNATGGLTVNQTMAYIAAY